jgi:cyclopropane-fatty-acyl-phospholipid synthase
MAVSKLKGIVQDILSPAGITVNGNHPWDIQIKDEKFYRRVLRDGSLGLGESYMDGWWDCEKLDEFFCRLIPTEPEKKIRKSLKLLSHVIRAKLLNPGRKAKAFEIGERHYDMGNELFRSMLDKRMGYSCAYWKNATNLDEAQEAKLDLICRKTALKHGERVLDIGCGWGGFARYAAEHHGVSVVGITVSGEQAEVAGAVCAGLPVEIRLQDYRDMNDTFDHIVSIGMFEHVGYKNHRKYMKVAHKCLKDEGLFLLHTIGCNESRDAGDPWFERYIFPNSVIPSMKQITASVEGLFVIEDWHNLGTDYDPTLMSWFQNFDTHWDRLKGLYDDRFYRMWKYYLLSCAGAFRARHLQVWQIVLSKHGVAGGYCSVR